MAGLPQLYLCHDVLPNSVHPSPIARTTNKPAHLEARGLTKGFGQGETYSLAVNSVGLRLHRNELTLLMGPSGSGKSTLLAMISGLLRPDQGQVLALNQDLWNRSKADLEQFRLKHCSYIFQGCNLFPALTARQQLELVLRWGEGIGRREARDRSQAMLEQLGLGRKAHLRPAQLSGGEKQRVAIARALVKKPDLLFADEPTSALDWENGQQVIELLRQAAHERGAMVLVVTHDPRLSDYADRVFHMEDGKMISEEVRTRSSPSSSDPASQTPPPRRLELSHLVEGVTIGY
jgi:putative ABC transport system ATP-binding protein